MALTHDGPMNRLILLIVALVLLVPPDLSAAEAPNDVRVLIDTSGSMKHSDPHNLRVPALKLLVNLFPEGTRGGVWLFDTHAQALVPVGTIDPDWKTKALKAAEQINARGPFTNIEEALTAADRDWLPDGPPGRRHIVLLTDGMVDVSRNADDSRASRERINAELIPRLQQEGIKVHTIALSDEADQDLMRQVAMATDGWNETAHDAEQLQRSFVQMFNQTTPHDSLPIKDNRFSVDAGIDEFTVLVLLPPGAKPTKVIAPDHTEISQAKPAFDARWVHEAGYDLITVPKPPAGAWSLEAAVDPANQVLVVTNLKMVATPVPNFLTTDERPVLAVGFTENGQAIEREDFLGLIAVKAALGQTGGHGAEAPLARASGPGAAQFSHRFEEALAPGEYAFTIVADGRTFQREYSQSFRVIEAPIKVTTETLTEGDNPHVRITLTPDPAAVVLDSLAVSAQVGYGAETVAGEAARQGEIWQLAIKPPPPGGKAIVNLTAVAKTPEGQDLKLELKPVVIEASEHQGGASPPSPVPDHAAEAAGPPHARPDWLTTLGVAAGVNLVVGLIGFLAYRMVRKRSQAAIDDLLSKLNP